MKVIPQVHERNADLNEVTLHVKLPEHNIFVAVKAPETNSGLQEQVAFSMFNTKMKECGILKDFGPDHAQASLSLLNLRNAEQFVHFSREGADIDLSEVRYVNYFLPEIKVNGIVIGIGCSISKKKAMAAAWLVAAVHMANAKPILLERYFNPPELISKTDGTSPASNQTPPIEEDHIDPTLAPPIRIDLPPKNLLFIENALRDVDRARSDNTHEELKPDVDPLPQRAHKPIHPLSLLKLIKRSEQLLYAYYQYKSRDDLKDLRNATSRLPASKFSTQILNMVSGNVYSIIVGATGSGKTTQVPQIILDHFMKSGKGAECNILCTQPRIIGAISVAKRVAEERGQQVGDQIGHRVRLDTNPPMHGGSITYCTTGVVLRQLQRSADYVFDKISHLIIDEVHTRDIVSDFTLAVLKNAVLERIRSGKKVPRIVIMSATMESELFASYLEINDPKIGSIKCPTLQVPGRVFSVRETYLDGILKTLDDALGDASMLGVYQEETTKKYLEAEARLSNTRLPACLGSLDDLESLHVKDIQSDSERIPLALVVATITHIAATTKGGAILVFLTGFEVLLKVQSMLEAQRSMGVDFQNPSKYRVFLLHSALTEDQNDVFGPMPEGCRKIILSTNIAETSVTIPDVEYVVDCGKHREYIFDQYTQTSSLPPTWISLSSSRQRAGRAGRVQNGHYYALFSEKRSALLSRVETAEILRIDLQQTCLSVKGLSGSPKIRDFLTQTVERPSPAAVDAAIANLTELGAITYEEEITPLGRLLNKLPMHPSLGMMVLLGVIYKCFDPILVLAASSTENRRLFISSSVGLDKKAADNKKIEFAAESRSDHLGIINAFNQFRRVLISDGKSAMEEFARDSFLGSIAFTNIIAVAGQLEGQLEMGGIIPFNYDKTGLQYGVPSLNENSSKQGLIRAIIAACTRVASRRSPNLYDTPARNKVIVHPGSVNVTVTNPRTERLFWTIRQRLLAYSSISLSSGDIISAFMRDTTEISPLIAVLFCRDLSVPWLMDGNPNAILTVDDWINVEVPQESADKLASLRRELRGMEKESFALLGQGRFYVNTAVRDVLVDDVAKLLEQDSLDVEIQALNSELAIRERMRGILEDMKSGPEDEKERALEDVDAQLFAEAMREFRSSGG